MVLVLSERLSDVEHAFAALQDEKRLNQCHSPVFIFFFIWMYLGGFGLEIWAEINSLSIWIPWVRSVLIYDQIC